MDFIGDQLALSVLKIYSFLEISLVSKIRIIEKKKRFYLN